MAMVVGRCHGWAGRSDRWSRNGIVSGLVGWHDVVAASAHRTPLVVISVLSAVMLPVCALL